MSVSSTAPAPAAAPAAPAARCCGADVQVIELSAATQVALHRCTECGRRDYVRAGVVVAPTEAYGELARSFRAVPAAARAQRDRVASQNAARAAARAAAQAARAAESGQQAVDVTGSRTVDVSDLQSLLADWQVLGASA